LKLKEVISMYSLLRQTTGTRSTNIEAGLKRFCRIMGNLEEALLESFQRAGLEIPATFPHTVAEFIHEMHRAHTKQSSEP
jgi:hypothetical protein